MEQDHPISAPGYPDNRSLFVLIPRQLKLKEKCGGKVHKKPSAMLVSLKMKYLLICKDAGSKIGSILINQKSYFSFLN